MAGMSKESHGWLVENGWLVVLGAFVVCGALAFFCHYHPDCPVCQFLDAYN
jgi:hypothetical protein